MNTPMPPNNQEKQGLPIRGSCSSLTLALVIFVCICLFAVMTYRRNLDYRSPFTLWQSAVKVDNLNPRAQLGLGTSATKEGKFDIAEEALLKTIAYSRGHRDLKREALNNLAVLEMDRNHVEAATGYLKQLLDIDPSAPFALYNLSLLLMENNAKDSSSFQEGTNLLGRLENILPHDHPRVVLLKSEYYLKSGKVEKALRLLTELGEYGLSSPLFSQVWAELASNSDETLFPIITEHAINLKYPVAIFFDTLNRRLLEKNLLQPLSVIKEREKRFFANGGDG